jgi:ABC-2 type transport system permease protein
MRRILHVAITDLRRMTRDRIYFFWTLVFPMFFILMFGLLFKADSKPSVAGLTVVNRDQGRWGAYFVSLLKNPGLELVMADKEPAEYNRLLLIPVDFSSRIEARQEQELTLKKREGASTKAAARVETQLVQAIARVIGELILYGDGDLGKFLDNRPAWRNLVAVKSRFPEKAITVVPSGFDHAIPGVTIQFIMMMVMIYGGVMVMEDRQKGILGRILFSPLSPSQLFQAKLLGRVLMGLVQALILIAIGTLFFHLNLGSFPLALLVITVFATAMAALSLFIGSRCAKEDLIVGISVLLSNIFAALGGCWWPNEIVPPGVRTAAMVSPAYWAMDALHKLIFFRGGFNDILPHLAVLLALSLVLSLLAGRYFRIRD